MSSEAPRPTPSDIVDALQISDLSFSPDGSHVIYSAKPYGKKGEHTLSALWLAETHKERSSRMLSSNLHNDRMARWSPDGRYLAFLSDRAGKETRAVYVVDLQSPGAESVPVTDVKCRKGIDALQWSCDSKYLAYLSPDETYEEDEKRKQAREDWVVVNERLSHNRLRVVDVEKRETRVLYKKNVHVTAFVWSFDGEDIVVLTQKKPGDEAPHSFGTEFEIIHVSDGETTHVAHFPADITTTSSPHSLVWPKRDDVWFVANYPAEELESSRALYKLSLSDKKWSVRGYGETECASDLRTRVATGAVYIKVQHAIEDGLHVAQDEAGGSYLGGHQIAAWDAAQTSDGLVYTYVYSDPATPPEVYIYNTSSNQKTQLSSHATQAFQALSESYSIHYLKWKSAPSTSQSQSFELQGILVSPQPASAAQKPLPTVVLVHGGPYVRQSVSFVAPSRTWLPALLASGEFNIMLPNYRGNAGQGKDLAQAIHGKAGTVDYDDVLAMVDEGIAQGFVDRERVAIGGWSWGGMISYLAAVRNGTESNGKEKGWRFRGTVCGAGACDGDLMAMLSDMHTFRGIMMGRLPWTSYSDDITARKCSAMWQVRKAVEEKRIPPVLILHGLADPRVPVQNAYAFNRAMEIHGAECEAALYPREPHAFFERASQLDMMERVVAFYKRVLEV